MHRLFVGIHLPRPIRRQLLDVMGNIHNVRWQDEEQLHLTLRFVGEVDRHCAEDLAAALQHVRHPALDLSLRGIGCFQRHGKGTLWAGVARQPALHALHKKVDQICRRAGIVPDGRAYHPHITLARFSRDAGPYEPFLHDRAELASPAFHVDGFRLYESRLGSEGARYETVARYPLFPSGLPAG